jgi:hypothetical protein
MPAARPTAPAPSSRLEEGREVYHLALGIADALDDAGMDLWAGGLRACLDADGTTARQTHLALELTRLSHTSIVRRAGLDRDVADALDRLRLGLGSVDAPAQPLYTAVRELADHLELHGGRRWLQRLRAVVHDTSRTAAVRVARMGQLLERMAPGAAGMPEGSAARVEAVVVRLPRQREVDAAADAVAFALRPPQASRRVSEGPPTADGRDALADV